MKKFTSVAAAIACAALVFINLSCANASNDASGSTPASQTPAADPGPVKYKVNIASSIEHGSVTASSASATAGSEITLTATPASGYVWSSYTVTGAGGSAVSVSAQGKFTMPESDVSVSATFVVGASTTLSNFASVISSLTQDSTIAMTGQLTSSDLATIKSALRALDPSQPKIKLDLRAVTGLDSLPQEALDGCPNLQSLSLPEGLASIGNHALAGCANLESLYLPASFSFLDAVELAFDVGQNFSSINVAEGNLAYSSVDGVLFSKDKKTLIFCPRGKSGVYTVPAGVTTIGQRAFDNCSKLTGIALPDSLLEICMNAFSYTSIASMTIPSSVVTISQYIFNGNTALTSLSFGDKTGWYVTQYSSNLMRRSGGTSHSFSTVASENADTFKSGGINCYYKAVAASDSVTRFKQEVADLTGDSTVKLEGQIKQTDLAEIYKAINEAYYKVKLDMSDATGLSSLPQEASRFCDKHWKGCF